MTSLTSLIERIDAATEGSRELDGLIWKAICEKPGDVWANDLIEGEVWLRRDPVDHVAWESPPAYSTSIDAALTLMPEGYAVTDLMIWPDEPSSATVVGTTRRPFGKDHRMSWVHGAGDGTWRGNGSTAPLALLAAILRARQTEATND